MHTNFPINCIPGIAHVMALHSGHERNDITQAETARTYSTAALVAASVFGVYYRPAWGALGMGLCFLSYRALSEIVAKKVVLHSRDVQLQQTRWIEEISAISARIEGLNPNSWNEAVVNAPIAAYEKLVTQQPEERSEAVVEADSRYRASLASLNEDYKTGCTIVKEVTDLESRILALDAAAVEHGDLALLQTNIRNQKEAQQSYSAECIRKYSVAWDKQELIESTLTQCEKTFEVKLEEWGKLKAKILIKEAGNGNLQKVQELVESGVPINAIFSNTSALIEAVKNNKPAVAAYLVQKSAIVDLPNAQGMTALMFAAAEVSDEIIRTLLAAKANPDLQDKEGNTALHYAVSSKAPGIITALVEAGAKLDLRNERGRTPLMETLNVSGGMLACVLSFEENVEVLIKAGAQVNLVDDDKMSALLFAARARNIKALKMLLAAQAEVDYSMGDTALHFIMNDIINFRDEEKLIEGVNALIAAGANINLKDQEGNTPIMLGLKRCFIGVNADKRNSTRLAVAKVLLAAGAIVSDETLTMLQGKYFTECTKPPYPVEIGFEGYSSTVAQREMWIATELWQFCATYVGLRQKCQLGLEKNNELLVMSVIEIMPSIINSPTIDGVTPLMTAASKGNYSLCKSLVEQGANRHQKDLKGRTASDHAFQHKANGDLVNFLKV